MKKLFIVLILAFSCFFAAQAQDQSYRSAIGLRLGFPVSVSYKQFISDPGAIEVFAGFRSYSGYSWFNVGGLYQHHFPIENAPGLQWYVGGGAAIYFWNFDNNFVFGDDDDSNTSFSILGNLGLDYKFANAPVNLSADWVPAFFLSGYGSGFGAGYGAFSARYTLN